MTENGDNTDQTLPSSSDETLVQAPGGPQKTITVFLNEKGIGAKPVNLEPDELEVRSGADERYQLGPELARGGMGAVLSAKDLNLRRDVAMKIVLNPHAARDAQIVRFVHEAQVTGQLEHPSIVPVYELGVDAKNHVYYTMKYVRGTNLGDILKGMKEGDRGLIGKYPLPRLLNIFVKACEALAFAHSRGVIHRDLKPDNLMVGDFGEVLIVDWGLAKVLGRQGPGCGTGDAGKEETEASAHLSPEALAKEEGLVESIRDSYRGGEGIKTLDGAVMGTPAYMPPEQASGDLGAMGPPADVYSMGGILYAILTLEAPYQGEDVNAILRGVLEGDLAAPELHRGEHPHCPKGIIPASLSAVVMKAMAHAVDERYPSVQALQGDVQAYLDGFATSAEEAGLWRLTKLFLARHRAVSLIALFAMMLLSVLAIGGPMAASRQKRLTKEARNAHAVAQEQREAADAATRKAQRTLVDTQTSRGVDAAAAGDHGAALLWFAEAGRQATFDANRRAANHIRARNAARDAPLAMGFLKVAYEIKGLRFAGAGGVLLVRGAGRLTVWDWLSPADEPLLARNASAVGMSRDGGTIAVASGPTVVFYRLPSTEPAHTLNVGGKVTAITEMPHGRNWALAIDGRIRVWDTEDKRWHGGTYDTRDQVYAITASPDGSKLAVAGRKDEAWVLRFENGELDDTALLGPVAHKFTDDIQGALVTGPVFADQGRALVSVRDKWAVTRYDLASQPPGPPTVIPAKHGGSYPVVIASPNAGRFAVIAHSSLRMYKANGEELWRVGGDRGQILSAAVSHDARLLLTANWDFHARLQDFTTGRPLGVPFRHEARVTRCAFSRDGRFLATGTDTGSIRIWRMPQPVAVIAHLQGWGHVPRLGPDGSLMSPGINHLKGGVRPDQGIREVRMLNTGTGQQLGVPVELSGNLVDSCVAGDNRTVAIAWRAGANGNPVNFFGLFDLRTGKAVAGPVVLPGDPVSLAAHPRLPQIAILHSGGLMVAECSTGKAAWHNHDLEKVRTENKVRYTPDGRTLVAMTARQVHLLKSSDGTPRCPPISYEESDRFLRDLAISPEGRHLAVATLTSSTSMLQVFEVGTGAPASGRMPVPGSWSAVHDLAFSPNGDIIAVGGAAREVRCWDWRRDTLVCPPLQHEQVVSGVCFTPQGALVTKAEPLLHFWDVSTGKPLARPLPVAGEAIACTPDGRRLLAASSWPRVGSVFDLDAVLREPEFNVAIYQLLAECSTGTRITAGDRSLLTNHECQQRFEELKTRWRWSPHAHLEPDDPILRNRLSSLPQDHHQAPRPATEKL